MTSRKGLPLLLMLAIVLAGCGQVAAQQPESGSVSSSQTSSSCLAAKPGESAPAEQLECKAFTSTAGSALGKNLSWVASTPLHMEFDRINESPTMVVRMPCGVLNIRVAIGTDAITPDPATMIESADGCTGSRAEQRAWTSSFVKTPMTYALEKNVLILTNDLGQLKFKSS